MINFKLHGRTETFYEVDDKDELREIILPYHHQFEWKSGYGKHDDVAYINVPCSFDIETTTYNLGTELCPKWVGFMYIWQFAFDYTAICGRTWAEFQLLLSYLQRWLKLKSYKRLPIYAHNAGFEFQFMRNFVNVEKVFARKKRIVVTADFNSAYQLRCSWALSNMGLAKAISTVPGAQYPKLDGEEFDYGVVRLPNTELTDDEYGYCFSDVIGLNEYLRHLLQNDNVASLPMTSTGFVRREVRKPVLENPANHKQVMDLALNPRTYVLSKTASRGGNCHASAYFANVEIDNVDSWDRKSSYPAEMEVADNFPVTAFRQIRPSNENLEEAIAESATLMDITFYNLELKRPTPVPYIAIAKCTRVKFDEKHLKDNGRVVACLCASMVITEIDYKIIDSQYRWSEVEISSLYIAKRGYLNREFRETLMEAFVTKCKLENGDKYLYNKYKNKINAYFGMMLTDICNPIIIYDGTKADPWGKEVIDIQTLLSKYYKSPKSFLSYQHGIWVTANARYELQLGLDAVGMDCVYTDTDSVKYIENHDADFQKLNERWLSLCESCDLSPIVNLDGKQFVLGRWEKEKMADKFKTIGAKKYCCIYGDELKTTVAGLSKEKGSKWLQENGGLSAFSIDTEVPAGSSGRTVSYYNDVTEPYTITIDCCDIVLGSNVAIVNTSYTFGVSEDYLKYYTSVQ